MKDATGQPLPGVTVLVKGTTTGTVTELDGSYTLTAPE
ncbi:carboxypeptidase-like regulatory domain-containing protein, partial [Algoriphagus boritolerans]